MLANSSQGYKILCQGVSDQDPVVRRKMAFLVGTLVMQSDEKYEGEIPNEVRNLIEDRMKSGTTSENLIDGMKREGVFACLIEALRNADGDDFEFGENALRALLRVAEKRALSENEMARVKSIWEQLGQVGQEERGLSGEDGMEISRMFG